MNALPRLHQNSQTVSLSLDTSLIQSVMRLDAPLDLVLDYTRTMMGALLLNPSPKHILMIGLGGGSLPKYCHAHMLDADITVVEINPDVIVLRDEFQIPPDDDRFRIVCADGAEFIRHPPQRYDWIMVDGYDGQGLPAALSSRSFYERCQAALAPEGILTLNLQADTTQCRQLTQRLGKLFEGQVLSIESDEGGNEIVLATSAQVMRSSLANFDSRWQGLAAPHRDTLAVCSTRIERALRKCPPSGNQTSDRSPC
ncbi:MAG: fused MFS/spermidine synthase [Burkholderiales bacterium]|nr:fused MFS/spermidine synthase [Burkholderiales bacterium]MDE2431494.1 fused MFS/spermidine synthase [Burkholderiales bacterium]